MGFASRNLRWGRPVGSRNGRKLVAVLAPAMGILALGAPGPAPHAAQAAPARMTSSPAGRYIVRAATVAEASQAVRAVGGRVIEVLGLVGGVEAALPPAAARELSSRVGLQVTPNVVMHALGASYGSDTSGPATAGSGPAVEDAQLARMDLGSLWSQTGATGVGVALIDTGVAPTSGLVGDHLVSGPDFSGDGVTSDGYGHGTFMAGLIAGNGTGGAGSVPGVAPGATVVSVKVADASGTTSLAQVIAGIGWAVAHKDDYDIRVMSISFGAVLPVDPAANPLDAAVEAAWAAGITVVAAAGNDGAGTVTSPGNDPWVITVGGETTAGTYSVPSWSGSGGSKPDVLAPAVSVVSLRAPGSTIDVAHPDARIGTSYFVGSGTSMATALTAGAAALLIHDHPDATPDDVKAALTSTEGTPLVGHAGPVDVLAADRATPSATWRQSHPLAVRGPGSGPGRTMPWSMAAGTRATWNTPLPSTSLTAVTWPKLDWTTMSWETMSWETMSWETMSWETMSWETMSWAGLGW